MENFKLKNFYHLLEYDFHIPSFQRGYRWEKKQIEDLLEDLKEFLDKGTSKFYCLQPIVVKKRDDGEKSYDVLDGQQRLTTIYLILSYLEKTEMNDITKTPKLFSLQFEIREKEEGDYLRNKRFKDINNGGHEENIDFFYIHKAYTVIDEWFNNNSSSKSDIENLLAAPQRYGDDEAHKDVRVIWYEIRSHEDAKEVFSNLNYGKIGLTETELVKALILQCDEYGDEKPYMSQWSLKVASDWDMIERELQEPTFMAMLATDVQLKESKNTLVSRIFFVLDLVAKYYISEPVRDGNKKYYKYKYEKNSPEQQKKNTSLNNPRYVYFVINQYLSGDGVDDLPTFKERVATLWGYVLDTFSVLKEWYKDHETYHKLGLLRLLDDSNDNLLFDLFANYTQKGKDEFRLDIKKRIGDKVRIVSKYKDVNGEDMTNTLATIKYGDHSDDIRKILKLFNVQLMIESHQDGARFDFAKFREQNVTSLEHIHPQNFNEGRLSYDDIMRWVENKKDDLGDCKELSDDFEYFDGFTEEKYENDSEVCMEHIHHIDKICDELAGMDENIMHSIKNMALIDKDTNSALQNNLIYKKRNKLCECSKNGKYVPIGTWHAFNKFFSQKVTDLNYWTEPDREAYYAVIERIYNEYTNR